MSAFRFGMTVGRRPLPSISEDAIPSQPVAAREFFLRQLSFVSGECELELANELVQMEIQAHDQHLKLLESQKTAIQSPKTVQSDHEELPVSTGGTSVADEAAATSTTFRARSRLATILEEEVYDPQRTFLVLGCWPMCSLQTCRRKVRDWIIRLQCRPFHYLRIGDHIPA